MIRIHRGPEPEVLRSERRRRLCQAVLARQAGREVDFSGYEVARDGLAEALNQKCAFCEKDLRKAGSPVEHFRPKALVHNEGEAEDRSRYWWLAWTWENLLFACFRCNSTYKKNQFPLEPGTAPLPEYSFDLDLEHPLLIDPARVDPREHIRFRWSSTRRRWFPMPVPGSKLAQKTITVLGLDEDDDPQRHFEQHVEPWIQQLEDQIRSGNQQAVQRTWKYMITAFFARGQAFQAFTWDVLDHHFPEKRRQTWGLELPSIGRHENLPPTPTFDDPPEMNQLPEELQLRVRALGSYASWDEARGVLRQVLRLGAWTDEQLARLFDRQESTIRSWRQKLMRSGS